MDTWEVRLPNGDAFTIFADDFNSAEDCMTFYREGEVVAMIKDWSCALKLEPSKKAA